MLLHHRDMTTTSPTTSLSSPTTAYAHEGASSWAAVRENLRIRRAERTLRHRIERELATYTSPSDRDELDAMVERADVENDGYYSDMIQRIRLRAA